MTILMGNLRVVLRKNKVRIIILRGNVLLLYKKESKHLLFKSILEMSYFFFPSKENIIFIKVILLGRNSYVLINLNNIIIDLLFATYPQNKYILILHNRLIVLI